MHKKANLSLHPIHGIIVAAITPIDQAYKPIPSQLIPLLTHFAKLGAHGALILGTTGEGPSFSPMERRQILTEAINIRKRFHAFKLLAGTGTPSLDETVELNKTAFDLGYDGVVVLPPYYFRKANEDGLVAWFQQVFRQSVPQDGKLYFYHIPQITGVQISAEFLNRIKDLFPEQFAGMKDSSGSKELAETVTSIFGDEFSYFTGTDKLLSFTLQNGGVGSITALSNLSAHLSRDVWDTFWDGGDSAHEAHLLSARSLLEKYPPFPPTIKAVFPKLFPFPKWYVRPPLTPLPQGTAEMLAKQFSALLNVK